MSVLENIKMAFSSLRAHKMRSILTMLGIIIGVGSVIAVVAIGQGGEAMLKSQIVGEANTTEVYYEPSDEEIQSNPNVWMENPFTQDDIDAIENISQVRNVVATSTESAQVRYREETEDGSITGINQNYLDVNKLKIANGRSLLAADFLGGGRSAIVSSSLQDELFDGEDILGEVIYVASQPIKVVGVLEKESGIFAFDSNEIYVPQKTWQSIFAKKEYSQVTIQANEADELNVAGEEAASMLNQMHNKDDAYQVTNVEEITEGIGQITGIMTIIIGSIAGVSLLVGGIGVMNIMLVSVTERTREIGVRMSLGATRGQILFQFLIESVTLTLVGGLVGMLFGAGSASIVSYFAGWPSLVSLPVIIGGILFSMVIGVVFGILPANKASRLDPIESLRYE